MPRRPLPLIAMIADLFAFTSSTIASQPPYDASVVIQSVTFDWSTHDRRAPGSDNWPITWADDGHQYAAWGDGGGFGGTNHDGRVSLGFARVEGDAEDYEGFNVWGGKDAPREAAFGGKSYGLICIDGVLHAWWGPGSNTTSYQQTRLLTSSDHGATWTRSIWDLTETDPTLIMPTILNFGRDYADARDAYVYHYFIRKQGDPKELAVHRPGAIDLARVPTEQVTDAEAMEWFAGLDDAGQPTWTADAAERRPVFEDPNGVGWNVSVSYNKGLGRYLLATEHTESFKGNLGLFDAPEPWGPWTTVAYLDEAAGQAFGHGTIASSTFFWNFANKWASDDGRQFVLIFTGIGENDAWNTVRGHFTSGP